MALVVEKAAAIIVLNVQNCHTIPPYPNLSITRSRLLSYVPTADMLDMLIR
jgi:hypothetical protein